MTAPKENKQIIAKAKDALGKYRIFKLSLIFIDIAAFSVFGGLKASNGILANWGCAHFENGKLIYNQGTLGTHIMLIASCCLLLFTMLILWRHQEKLRLSHGKVVMFSFGLLISGFAFLLYPCLTSLFFVSIVVGVNIVLSFTFTHCVNTYLLGVEFDPLGKKINVDIKDPSLNEFCLNNEASSFVKRI